MTDDPCDPGSGPKRLTMSEADRRRHIVDAASCVFAEKGYRATTMDEVSRRAGMSKKTVYQLFGSKAEIFDSLLSLWARPFHLPVETEGLSQREVLTRALHRLGALALDAGQIAITRVLIAEAARPGEVADALEALGIGRGYWALEQWLASQTALGHVRVEDPVELAAMLFFACFGDTLINALLRIRPCPNEAQLSARIATVVAMYFEPRRASAAAVDTKLACCVRGGAERDGQETN